MTQRNSLYRIISIVAFLSIWEIGGRLADSDFLLPPFSGVVGEIVRLITDPDFWAAMFVTSQSFIWGFSLAILAGIPFGLMIGLWRFLDRLSSVYIILMLTTPIAPLVPLVIIILGIGLSARVFLVFIFALPMIVMNTATGVREVSPSLLDMARSFGASNLDLFRRICLPGSLPAMMAGVRLGAARAVVAMIVGELIIVTVGIGALMMEASARFRTAELFAVTTIILSLGYFVVKSIQIIEGILFKWKPTT